MESIPRPRKLLSFSITSRQALVIGLQRTNHQILVHSGSDAGRVGKRTIPPEHNVYDGRRLTHLVTDFSAHALS